nr:MAG TPA: hypothetical protein [Caudoviricetes sp.]
MAKECNANYSANYRKKSNKFYQVFVILSA